ncbi:ankyrin repeat domain-containing protein [Chryseobacterium sp. YR221]|uniref:ankyrin repeat domain-containing protein n=1 Tax=Chryseobacterium sp. YR221 TaxID=1500293 RepID=UPI0009D7E498|nr:ankyrin repeat domain-containing protein [Chryseobacterium sp. YR221]SMC55574.1 Ankyrin repeat [Chryseobacterium sp. YR221]
MKKIGLYILLLAIISCNKIDKDKKVDKNKLLGADYRLFQDTPAWGLAKAVWDNDVEKIDEEVKKNPKVLDYQERKYGKTLLHLSSYNDNYKAFKELLRLGANPNIADSSHCTSPLIEVVESSKDKTQYVEQLIKYKANVNYVECIKGKEKQKTKRTALITASGSGYLTIVKLLVQNGADINYNDGSQSGSALGSATLSRNYDIVLYLLQKGADCNLFLYKKYNSDNSETPIYMKDWINHEADHSAKEYPEIINILKKNSCL